MPLDDADFFALERIATAMEIIADNTKELISVGDGLRSALSGYQEEDTVTKAIERVREQLVHHAHDTA